MEAGLTVRLRLALRVARGEPLLGGAHAFHFGGDHSRDLVKPLCGVFEKLDAFSECWLFVCHRVVSDSF